MNAQRRLGSSSSELRKGFERLSSGLRVVNAGDDAAGLAIASSLRVDSRVYVQGIRNTNDAISVLDTTEGALLELSSITIRQRELANQAANGVYSVKQRTALHAEANALVEEYNRIVRSLDFNGIKPLDLSLGTVRIQGGYGEQGGVAVTIGEELARLAGTGAYTLSATGVSSSGNARDSVLIDANGDGVLDVVGVSSGGTLMNVALGVGDGTFGSSVLFSGGDISISSGDFNGDGITDVVAADAGTISINLGNTNGTFKAPNVMIGSGGSVNKVEVGDVDGDGKLDVVTIGTVGANNIYFGRGNGNFNLPVAHSLTGSASFDSLVLADVNADGNLDMFSVDGTGSYKASIGLGRGAFTTATAYALGSNLIGLSAADFDRDGFVDLVASSSSSSAVFVLLSNGDGSFTLSHSMSALTSMDEVKTIDANTDGLDDLLSVGSTGRIVVHLSNGNGTFQAAISSTGVLSGLTPISVTAGDLDGDGVLDLMLANPTNFRVVRPATTSVTTTPYINLLSAASARDSMKVFTETLNRIGLELGAVGSSQSRLRVAVSNLSQGRENFDIAASAILDVDVATEAGQLVKQRILQQSAASILSQANQLPQLALRLLQAE